jgi:AAA family ATPase
MSTFLLRPSNSEKEAFRIKLTAASLLGLRLKPGDLCTVRLASELDNNDETRQRTMQSAKYAIAWDVSGTGMKDGIVQMSKFLQDLYGFKLGDKMVVGRCDEKLEDAGVVKVRLRTRAGQAPMDEDEMKFWMYYLKLKAAEMHECVAEGQILTSKVAKETKEFEVCDVGASGIRIAKVGDGISFDFIDEESAATGVNFKATGIGGLTKEVEEMQKLVSRLLSPRISLHYSPVQGVLIYGAKGVGKSHFTSQLAASGWSSVIRWTPGAKIPKASRPTLILIDQLDMPASQGASRSLLRELDQLFTTFKGSPCMIVGETRHPNDVDVYLRSEGKFSVELEIPIPSAMQRKDILLAIRSSDTSPSDDFLQQVAERTHGYVAADLKALLRRILELASESEPTPNGTSTPSEPPSIPQWPPSQSHLDTALTQIRPSALQEIFLETPSTRWTDIGGHHALKHQLINAVTRPLHSAARMAKLGLRAKKGVLLYGPPGCSKTLLVRALANEAGLNFLAVKGAELISMYVGESERATREVFRKARAAAPSIVFFDEIDAIASRKGGGSSGELNVLTTLLNEMDGFEELKGVFIVAATNKPDRIDEALLRPGRFDNVVYVGAPDEETRREIFLKQFQTSSYVSAWPSEGPAEAQNLADEASGWASKTGGFSGAEVVAICQTAKEYALDEERDHWNGMDVEKAIAVTPKSITKEMLEGFETWNAARMR